jgi:hypothetical protein
LRTTLALTLVTAALLGGTAPVAGASVVPGECRWASVSVWTPTGDADTFRGAAYGVAGFDDQATHTLRCTVRVDGADAASTPAGSGSGFVVTAGPVVYDAGVDQVVDMCTEVDGVTTSCAESTTVCPCIPDTDLLRALDPVFDLLLQPGPEDMDTLVCPLLESLSPGVPGVVDVTPDGDTTLAGFGPFWDCPPYGDLFPPE